MCSEYIRDRSSYPMMGVFHGEYLHDCNYGTLCVHMPGTRSLVIRLKRNGSDRISFVLALYGGVGREEIGTLR